MQAHFGQCRKAPVGNSDNLLTTLWIRQAREGSALDRVETGRRSISAICVHHGLGGLRAMPAYMSATCRATFWGRHSLTGTTPGAMSESPAKRLVT